MIKSRITKKLNKYCYFNHLDRDDRKLKRDVKKAVTELLGDFNIYAYSRLNPRGELSEKTLRAIAKEWGDAKIPRKEETK